MTGWFESDAIAVLTSKVSCLEKGWEDTTVVGFPGEGSVVLSTDQITVSHAYPGEDVRSLVRRGVTEAISDVAASGAALHGVQIDVRAPSDFNLTDFEAIGLGVDDVLRREGGMLLQGSNISRGEFGVSTTAVGRCDGVHPPMRRSGATTGDLVAISGPVGAWNAALRILNQGLTDGLSEAEWVSMSTGFVDYTAEMAYGKVLRESGVVTSCIDANDQVGKSLVDLAFSNRLAVLVSAEAIPLSNSVLLATRGTTKLDPLEIAVGGVSGDDRLIFTLAPTNVQRLQSLLHDRLGREAYIVGSIEPGHGAVMNVGGVPTNLPLDAQPSSIYSRTFDSGRLTITSKYPRAGKSFTTQSQN